MEPTAEGGYVVTPGGSDTPLADLWRGRGALWALALREVEVRYRHAFLGAGWAAVQPLALAAVAAAVYAWIAGGGPSPTGGGGLAAVAWFLPGLVAWTFFQGAVGAAVPSLVANASLVRKTWFPRESVPLAHVVAGMLDLGVGVVLAVALAAATTGALPPTALLAAPLLLVLVAFATGCALLGAALNVPLRDVKHALPLLLQLLFLASPLVYPLSRVPAGVASVLAWNPLAAVAEGLRAVLLLGEPPTLGLVLPGAAVAAATLLLGWATFRALDRRFADVL